MNLLFKRSKRFLVSIVVFALLLVSNIGLIGAMRTFFINEVNASEFLVENSVSISNNKFSDYTSGDLYPYTPSNFTFSSQTDSSTVKHGVINLSESVYNKNYVSYNLGKDENPGFVNDDADNYCLMINSRNSLNMCGYKSNSVTFTKNSNYYVSVNVYTDSIDGSASLYLFDGNDVFAEIKNINTHGSWQKYYFFVSTNNYEDLLLNLGLWQGSKITPASSCVFFDQISSGEISESTISSMLNDNSVDGKVNCYKGNICYKNLADENLLESYETIASNDLFAIAEEGNGHLGDINYTSYGYNYLTINGNVVSTFKIQNKKSNYATFDSREFVFDRNKVYKLSLKVKAEDITVGTAFMKLVEVLEDGSTATPKSSDAVSISSTSNKFDGEFAEYSIFVNSDPTKVRTFKLQVGLGNSDTQAKGTVYFKDLDLYSVPFSQFSSVESSNKTLDLSTDYTTSGTIGNDTFDISTADYVANASTFKINTPKNWTVKKSGSSNVQVAGVYNVNDFDNIDRTELFNFANPGLITKINDETNNMLMLYNAVSDVLTCSSDSFTLTKDSYYRISVWVQTQINGANQNGANISIIKADSDLILASVEGINTTASWTEYVLNVKTGYEDVSCNLVLSLGRTGATSSGYAYFDNCVAETSTEAVYTSAVENDTVYKMDLTNPLAIAKDSYNNFFEGNSVNIVESSRSGLVNLDADLTAYLMGVDESSAKSLDVENKNALAIHATDADYYTISTRLNYSLTASSYYKVTVDVYTAYINVASDNLTNKNKAGASIKLSNIENSEFTAIVSDKAWTTYSFYICPTSDVTTQLTMAIGSSSVATTGTVLFANINFEKISEKSDYENLVDNADNHCKVVGTVSTTDDDENTEDKKDKNDINWVLLSSTFTAVAVIIAVLGVGIKKLLKPGKKHYKKSKVEYSRENSVLKQKYRRLAHLKRDKEVRNLTKKLEAINTDKLDKENKYKQLLTKVREVKVANTDGKLNGELLILNKELKKASHLSAKSGVMSNKIVAQIEFIKTEGYILNLEKTLAKQDELAHAKGTSIEEILAKDEDIVLDEEVDTSLDEAITKADKIISDKKEQDRLEQERIEKEKERLEQERLEKERLDREEQERISKEKVEQERLEQERLLQEKLEQERLEKEKAEKEAQEKAIEEANAQTSSKEIVNSNSEDKTESNEELVEKSENIAESAKNEEKTLDNTEDVNAEIKDETKSDSEEKKD